MTPQSEIKKELNAISQTVADLPKKTPFQVPDGYFEHFPAQLLSKVQEKKEEHQAKVFRLSSSMRWIRYAAAASVVGLLFAGGLYFFRELPADQKWTADVLQTQNDPVSEDAIQSYLDDMDEVAFAQHGEDVAVGESLLEQMDRETVSTLLAQIPESGIEQFISERNKESYSNN